MALPVGPPPEPQPKKAPRALREQEKVLREEGKVHRQKELLSVFQQALVGAEAGHVEHLENSPVTKKIKKDPYGRFLRRQMAEGLLDLDAKSEHEETPGSGWSHPMGRILTKKEQEEGLQKQQIKQEEYAKWEDSWTE